MSRRALRAARRAPVLLSLLLAPSGCAPVYEFPAAATVSHPAPERYPGAPAVVLLREDKMIVRSERTASGGGDGSRVFHHEQRAILTDEGRAFAAFEVPAEDAGARIALLEARAVRPGGAEQRFDRDEILEAADHAQQEGGARVFRFPDAAPGTVVEFAFATDAPTLIASHRGRVAPDLPVERYRLELFVTPELPVMFRAYNVPPDTPVVRDRVGGFAHVMLHLHDLAPPATEELTPPWSFAEPWWIFRVREGASEGDWGAVARPVHAQLQQPGAFVLPGDLPAVAPDGACAGPRCLADRALAVVRDKTVMTGFADALLPARPLDAVLATGTANSSEKALLALRLLQRAGVIAHLAAAARGPGVRLDPTFAAAELLDHLLVLLPPQPGLDAPLWIDPSCEQCAAGEVPPWLEGCDAVVMSAQGAALEPIAGPPPTSSLDRRDYDARVLDGGDLEVTAVEEERGMDAERTRHAIKGWSDQAWRESAEDFVRARAPSARLVEHTPYRCEAAPARCTRTIKFVLPGWTSKERAEGGERLRVPLGLLGSAWDGMLLPESRRGDLFFGETDATAEVLTLRPPAGWELANGAAPVRVSTPAVTMSLEVVPSAGGAVQVRRWLSHPGGRFPRDTYRATRDAVRLFAAAREGALAFKPTALPPPPPVAAPAPEPAPAPTKPGKAAKKPADAPSKKPAADAPKAK